MNKNNWALDEIEEHDTLLAWVCDQTTKSGERKLLMIQGLNEAIADRRPWARELQSHLVEQGARNYIVAFEKSRNEFAVAWNGEVVTKPAVVGTTTTDATGDVVWEQKLFAFLSWEAIERKRTEYLKQIRAYTADIHACDRLLALRDLAPGAANPSEAAAAIGTTVDDWLATAS